MKSAVSLDRRERILAKEKDLERGKGGYNLVCGWEISSGVARNSGILPGTVPPSRKGVNILRCTKSEGIRNRLARERRGGDGA